MGPTAYGGAAADGGAQSATYFAASPHGGGPLAHPDPPEGRGTMRVGGSGTGCRREPLRVQEERGRTTLRAGERWACSSMIHLEYEKYVVASIYAVGSCLRAANIALFPGL